MWQWFLRGLTVFLVAGTCLLPSPARAQTQAANPNAPSLSGGSTSDTEKGHPPPVAAYAAAVLFTITVLVLVCMPSRKGG